MAVKTTKAGSIKALRASVERKGGGNEAFLQRVPADDSITVRFLTEPEEWQSYFEHYDQIMKYYPCSDNCPGCTEGDRPSQRYLANALRTEDNKVVPMVIPKTLVTKLLNSYDRYNTLIDRDYELIRLGSGLDTDYDRSPETPAKRNLKGVQLLDLAEVLENQLKRAFDDGSGDDLTDDEPTPPKRPSSRPGNSTMDSIKAKPKAKPQPVIDDDDDDDDEEETPTGSATRDELENMSLRELRVYAKSEMGIAAADLRGMDQDALVELIIARSSDADPDDEDDDEEEVETPDDEDEADADEEDADAEEDDDEELTEDEIRAMTIAELRKLCGQLEISWKRTDGKALLIKKILESVGEDEDDEDGEEPPF